MNGVHISISNMRFGEKKKQQQKTYKNILTTHLLLRLVSQKNEDTFAMLSKNCFNGILIYVAFG